MAGSFGDYLAGKILDHILKVTPFVVPTNLYIALYSVAPTDVGGGTELSGSGYARALCNDWTAASGSPRLSSNSIQVLFADATADWNEVVAFAVWDALTSGNFLKWADLITSRTILEKDAAKFNIGNFIVTLD